MSSEMWAMGMLRKYKLTVDFYMEYVENTDYFRLYWGLGKEDYLSFEDALTAMIKHEEGK